MSVPIRVLELRSVRGTGGGPEKTIVLGAARADRRRFAIVVAYVRDARDAVFGVDLVARRHGVDYEEIIEKHSFDPGVIRRLRALVRRRRIDIVHAHDYKTDALALMLAHTEGIIPLSTAHGWTGDHWRERLLYYPADRQLLRAFPRVLAISSEIAAVLRRAGVRAERIRTVLNGIDPDAFKRDPRREASARTALAATPGDFVIGAVGRAERQKRFDVLLEACARVAAAHPAVCVRVAGDGSLRTALQRQAERLFAANRAQFMGHQRDVSTFHHGLDLFVQSSDYEGTPNAVLEAMALGTPIVATVAGGTAELVRDGVDGLLVPPNNVEALARAIAYAVENRAARARWVASARRRVEQELSFASRQDRLERIYDELIASRNGRDHAGPVDAVGAECASR